MEKIKNALGLMALVLVSAGQSFAQSTNIQIINATANEEGAISIKWESCQFAAKPARELRVRITHL